MRLPGPGPGDLFAALGKGADQVDALLGAVPRMIALLGLAEVLLVRATAAIEQVEVVTDRATGVVTRTSAVVDRAEAQVARLTPLLDGLEPPLTKLQPTLEVLADTTHPDEVAALVRLVDHLPELTARVENDVLPVMATLGSVAPDLRRIDQQQGEDGTTASVRD